MGKSGFNKGSLISEARFRLWAHRPGMISAVELRSLLIPIGPTVVRGARNFEPNRGIFRGIRLFFFSAEFVFYRGISSFPRTLTVFIRTTQKMTSMLMAD